MKTKKIILGLFACLATTLVYSDSGAMIWVDRSNGVFGHYKTVTEDHFEQNGETIDYLACADPGWSRCRFAALMSTGGEDLAEAEYDEILSYVDAEISNNHRNGSYTSSSGKFYATWFVGPINNTVKIYSYQEAVDLGLI